MPISKSDIKLYLTSVEPEIEQTVHAQSLGNYPAVVPSDITKSLVYPEATLAESLSLFDDKLVLNSVIGLENFEFLNINFEVMSTSPLSGALNDITERAINGLSNVHIGSDIARGLFADSIFNDKFNNDLKQYRCIAIKNISSETAFDVEVYLKQNSRNPGSDLKIALEIPQSDYLSGTATSGSKLQLIDTSLIGVFADNHFDDALLRMRSGSNVNQSRIVLSFDSSTGTFILDSSMPNVIVVSDTYEVDPGPAQRVISGTVSPSFNTARVSELSVATKESSIPINVNSNRDNVKDLKPNDVVYVWLERRLKENSTEFNNNSAILTLNYKTS